MVELVAARGAEARVLGSARALQSLGPVERDGRALLAPQLLHGLGGGLERLSRLGGLGRLRVGNLGLRRHCERCDEAVRQASGRATWLWRPRSLQKEELHRCSRVLPSRQNPPPNFIHTTSSYSSNSQHFLVAKQKS